MTLSINEARRIINARQQLDTDQSFDIARACALALRNQDDNKIARDTIIRALDAWHIIPPETTALWNDLVEVAGLYPYVTPELLSESAQVRYEFSRSHYLPDVYFHEEQNTLSLRLLGGKSVVLSAPTSFGKSLLIEEIVASYKYKDIVIIQPTLALLDETRKKLHRYRKDYNILVSTTQNPSDNKGNIFLFTAERAVEYTNFKKVDFFVIDEFYKLSLNRADDRAHVLNHAFYKLLKLTTKFYLLGPLIKGIPSELRSRYELDWVHTNFATVAVDEIPYTPFKDEPARRNALFKLLLQLPEPTLIYCSAPQKATEIGIEFVTFLLNEQQEASQSLATAQNHDIIGWLNENVHPRWSLVKMLEYSIAFHHGALPRHLGSSIVDAFNSGGVRLLFCTSTLIEGVNTTAKNVILFDKRKGPKPIDFFDYKNIAGRSGRMNVHYIGRVYKFHAEPSQMELDVDIPIITQSNAPLEMLIQLDPDELSPASIRKLDILKDVDPELVKIIKFNSGLPVEGQLQIVKLIDADIQRYHVLLAWNGLPGYRQLQPVVELAWNYLMKKGDSKAYVRSANQLTFLTIKYLNLKSIPSMIRDIINDTYTKNEYPDEKKRTDWAIFLILSITRNWFDYKLPKLIGAVSALQKHVFTKYKLRAGDYTYFASLLENGFLSKEIATLLDLDLPLSAIRKIQSVLPKEELSTEKIIEFLSTARLDQFSLNNYELKKIRSLI